MPVIAAIAEWDNLMRRLNAAAPEAFTSDQRALNLMEGEWKDPGFGRHYTSSVDGRSLGRIPMIDLETALRVVRFAKSEADEWAKVSLDQRQQRVRDCLAGLRKERELIALLLIWEIGKPYAQALTDIDRCISGVEWYIENIDRLLGTRTAHWADFQHRLLELSDVGADALGAGAGASRQRDYFQNAH